MSKTKIVPPTESRNELIDVLVEFSRDKSIDRATLMGVLEDVFRSMIRKKYGSDENFNIIVNVDKGDIQAFRERTVVEDGEVEDETLQIPLSEALKIDEDFEVGDDVPEEISFFEFGRRIVMAAKQTLAQRIKELEKSNTYEKYKELIGSIIVGEVYQTWRSEIMVIHDDIELVLPKSEQIPKDRYKKGDAIRAVVLDVVMKNSSPVVTVSRTSPTFLQRLFELEVPEISDGLITIKSIVRDPGERAKIAVESYDERIDPVGACVGMKGTRIHGIVRELRNENIDVINYSSNPSIFVQRALTPAKVSTVVIDEDALRASVYLKADQVSLAIGKGGQNIKLASSLTNYTIDVYRENDPNDEDVDLDEFSDEIDGWIIEALKDVGLDTAKSVLALTPEEISRRTELELDLVEDILSVLRAEFED